MLLWICLRWPDPSSVPATSSELHRLALAMLEYSPRVACFHNDSVVLEVSASLLLFQGVLKLCRRVLRSASHLSAVIRMGLAPSATGAWLLAGSPCPARRRVLRRTSLTRHLNRLPCHHLPEAQPYLQWLKGIGCQRLGDLRALPRQGLQQRSSPLLTQALDSAYAQAPETLAWFIPPARFRLAHEPDFHPESDAAILAGSQPLLQALCHWLQHRQEALHDFTLVLHHEKGRAASPPVTLNLQFSTLVWRQEDFTLLLTERLRHLTLPGAVVKLELIAGPSHPRAPVSDTLFPDPARHHQEERRLLDLLAARLGHDAIRRPRPLPHHLPELANTWATDPAAPASSALPTSVGLKPRPFWLLPQPLPLRLQQHRPLYQGRPLRLLLGPERLETGWWNHDQRRDYFVAEDPEGARYWIYRQRETGEGWFLHGLFA